MESFISGFFHAKQGVILTHVVADSCTFFIAAQYSIFLKYHNLSIALIDFGDIMNNMSFVGCKNSFHLTV